MESMVFPKGGWCFLKEVGVWGLVGQSFVASPESHWSYWDGEKTAHEATKLRGRNGIAMIVE